MLAISSLATCCDCFATALTQSPRLYLAVPGVAVAELLEMTVVGPFHVVLVERAPVLVWSLQASRLCRCLGSFASAARHYSLLHNSSDVGYL